MGKPSECQHQSSWYLARWLVCPTAAVAVHWSLITSPGQVLAALPVLWPVEDSSQFEEQLRNLEGMKELDEESLENLLKALEVQRDRATYMLLLLLAIVLWLGIGVTLAPLIYHYSDVLKPRAAAFCHALHRWGVLEVVAYFWSVTISVQGCRYPSLATTMDLDPLLTSFVGTLCFVASWIYSTSSHAGVAKGQLTIVATQNMGLPLAGVLIPLALAHRSGMFGLLAIASLHFGLVMLLRAMSTLTCTSCCLVSSGLVTALLPMSGRALPSASNTLLDTLGTGAACWGHLACLTAMLCVASNNYDREATWMQFLVRQAMFLAMLGSVALGSWLWELPSLLSAAFTFGSLWLLQKEFEASWNKLAVKLPMAYFILQYLYNNSDYVLLMFDPRGLYL